MVSESSDRFQQTGSATCVPPYISVNLPCSRLRKLRFAGNFRIGTALLISRQTPRTDAKARGAGRIRNSGPMQQGLDALGDQPDRMELVFITNNRELGLQSPRIRLVVICTAEAPSSFGQTWDLIRDCCLDKWGKASWWSLPDVFRALALGWHQVAGPVDISLLLGFDSSGLAICAVHRVIGLMLLQCTRSRVC